MSIVGFSKGEEDKDRDDSWIDDEKDEMGRMSTEINSFIRVARIT